MAFIKRGGGGGKVKPVSGGGGASPAPPAAYTQNPVPVTTDMLKGNGAGGLVAAVSGTDFAPGGGVSATYTVDATVSGSVTSLTFTGGVLTGATVLP